MKLISNSFVFLFSIFLTSSIYISCSKDEGCTKPGAINYDKDADKDNGSCKSEGKVMFWINSSTNSTLLVKGIDSLYFYIGSKFIGAQSIHSYHLSEPECDMGFVYEGATPYDGASWVDFKVTDKAKNLLWNDKIVLPANQCNKLELVNPK